MSTTNIEDVILDENFSRFVFVAPLVGDERKTAIEYYKMARDYGAHVMPIEYKKLKHLLQLLYELEQKDIEIGKVNIADIARNTKDIRLLLDDKIYLEQCLTTSNEVRHKTDVMDLCKEIKDEFVLMEEKTKLIYVEQEGSKASRPKMAILSMSCNAYSNITSPIQQGIEFFGGDYAYTVEWVNTVCEVIINVAKMNSSSKLRDLFNGSCERILNLWGQVRGALKPYYSLIKKSMNCIGAVIAGKHCKLEINMTPQWKHSPQAPYGWSVSMYNKEKECWEHTNIFGWAYTPQTALDDYYSMIYKEYIKYQIVLMQEETKYTIKLL